MTSSVGLIVRRILGIFILDPPAMVALQRASHRLHGGPLSPMAWPLKAAISVFWGADIHPGADLATGVRFAHTQGVVIGEGVVIERDVEVFGGVTLGHRGEWTFPRICEGAILYSGCCVLGGVRVGKGARIGANAVVLADVPPYRTAVGVPARLVED